MRDIDKFTDENFSRELLHAIAANEGRCFEDLTVLSSGDVAVLKQVLRGEKVPPILIDKKRAVTALANSERSAEASAILAGVMADLKETTQVRGAAAAQLSVMPKESAEKALMENLETGNEIIRREVRKSLVKIGSEKVDRDNVSTMPGAMRQKKFALPIPTGSLAR
ncbi:MAG TPA: hypothetical protein VFI24_27350 [Pyrinomonadaceae bacterium]|nr:hypothetical protein [Pyrinomonadaceae bacterium]